MSIVQDHTLPGTLSLLPPIRPGASPRIHRFSIYEYHHLPQPSAGNHRLELLDGWIVERAKPSPEHVYVVETLRARLEEIVKTDFVPRGNQPLTLTSSEPIPDAAVIKGENRHYRQRHPGGADVRLVIEVAETSLAVDQRVKGPIYAAAGIPVYWIIDIAHRRAEVHRLPSGNVEGGLPGYREHVIVEADGVLSVVLDGREWGQIRPADFFDLISA